MRAPEERSRRLDRRLAEISRRRAGSVGDEAGRPAPGPRRVEPDYERAGVEEILSGGPLAVAEGRFFLHERLRSSIETPHRQWGRLPRARGGRPAFDEPEWSELAWQPEDPVWNQDDRGTPPSTLALEVLHAELEALVRLGLGDAVFLDLETGGLSQACVFLAGTMRWNGSDFVLRQYFARDYSEERALVAALCRYLAEARAVVTFNGRSFDVPFLRDRATAHRVPFFAPELHVDLLHHSRARWRHRLPNCRLVTLEAFVCRRRRVGDVPGERIPGLYHEFVRDGDPHRLVPVFHHNLLDVITMEELLQAVVREGGRP